MKQQICYFKGRSNQLKTNESGRTMLEMLGVLGIMGIIMYGAVAGINYGMSTYKINQTYNEIQEAIQGIQDMYSWSRDYGRNISFDTLRDNDVFPKDTNPFAGDISVEGTYCEGNYCGSFMIIYDVSDEDSQNRLMEMDWGDILAHKDGGNMVFCPRPPNNATVCD